MTEKCPFEETDQARQSIFQPPASKGRSTVTVDPATQSTRGRIPARPHGRKAQTRSWDDAFFSSEYSRLSASACLERPPRPRRRRSCALATTPSCRRTSALVPAPPAGCLSNYSPDVAGFATKTSFNLGESIPLKLGRASVAAASTVRVDVYRMGYYGNQGGRLITAASSTSVSVNNLFSGCSTTNATTGLKSCTGWATSYTIPGVAIPASGVYTVKLTTPSRAREHRSPSPCATTRATPSPTSCSRSRPRATRPTTTGAASRSTSTAPVAGSRSPAPRARSRSRSTAR